MKRAGRADKNTSMPFWAARRPTYANMGACKHAPPKSASAPAPSHSWQLACMQTAKFTHVTPICSIIMLRSHATLRACSCVQLIDVMRSVKEPAEDRV